MSHDHIAGSQPDYSYRSIVIVAACFVFSGATGLIYEVLWARMLGLVFGVTTLAIGTVLAAFMGGLAFGSALAAKFSDRIIRSVRAYGVLEIAIGLYALAVPLLFRLLDRVFGVVWPQLRPGFYASASLRFALAALVLLLPTSLMGATFPVLTGALKRQRGISTTTLYAGNLTGAILGAIAAGFALLPIFGVRATIWIAATANIGIGIIALLIDSRSVATAEPSQPSIEVTVIAPDDDPEFDGRYFWFASAVTSGFATISMQVVWSRLLAMIIGSSTYAFSIVLGLFLTGLAIGAYAIGATRNYRTSSLRRAVCVIAVLTAIGLFMSIRVTNLIPSWLVSVGFRLGVTSWSGLLVLQIGAAALLLAPTILMGMVLPLVLAWTQTKGASTPRLVGKIYALNTLGAIFGAIVTAFLLLPGTTTRFTTFCITSLCLVLAGVAYQPGDRDPAIVRSLSVGVALSAIVVAFVFWPLLNLNTLSAGAYDSFVRVLARSRGDIPDNNEGASDDHQLLMYEEGRTATVSVRRDWGITSVAINGRTNASDGDDMPTQILLGQIGVLMAPRLEQALVVGFATGVTPGSVLQSSINSVDCVEIEPAAVASSRFFETVNNRPLSDPRLHLVIDDARTYLRVNPATYDLIVSEPSHPWVPGVANLFTREFFELGRNRLRDDGVFVQWLQIYQLSVESLRSLLATFQAVFPHVAVFRVQGAAKGKDLILIGSHAPIDLNRIDERTKDPRTLADVNRAGLKSSEELRAWFVCDETRLARAIAGAVINTDDNMHVETVAPREAFRPTMEANAAWIENLRRPPNR